MSMDEIEVRIHYGAPSSRRNDDDFRAQGEAYRGWTSSKIISLSRLPIESSSMAILVEKDITSNASTSKVQQICSQTVIPATNNSRMPIYVEDESEATKVLQPQLPSSSSVVTKIPETVLKAVPSSRDESVLEASLNSSSDRSYMKTPTFSRSNKRKRHSSDSDIPQYRIRRPAAKISTIQREQPRTSGKQLERQLDLVENAQVNTDPKSDEIQSTSNLPTTYSLSDKHATSKSNSNEFQRSNSAPASSNLHSSRSTQTSEIRVGMAEQHAAIQQNQPDEEALLSARPQSPQKTALEQEQQLSDANNQEEDDVADEDETQSETGTAAYFANDGSSLRSPPSIPDTMTFIKSPPEPILHAPFETHISKQLTFLAQCADMKDVYKPVSVTHEMDKWERGHWLFNISSWPSELQTSFWAFLSSFITKGAAGYMVMCCRGAENQAEDKETVKLYCYAEVAMHLYLLLYTASNSKVRNMGLQWKDSAGKVIIQMPKTS